MNDNYLAAAKEALMGLLEYYNGNKSQMARDLNVTRAAVHHWLRRGYIGKKIAIEITERTDLPFSKEKLRPDIKVWDHYNYAD
jgi:hypothetical protein